MSATFSVGAQDSQINALNESHVVVYLNSGSKIEGKMLHWEMDLYIEIETTWGQKLRFYENQYKKFIQKSALETKPLQSVVYNFKEKGFYSAIKGQLILGNDGPRAKGAEGIGFSASVGHKFNRFLAIGGGIGYDQYILNSGEDMIPLFTEFSGFFQAKNTSLFYNLQTGYSFASTDDVYLLSEAKGGLMVYPSIGIRFGGRDIKYTFDIGYKFQDAEFTYDDQWDIDRKRVQDVKFKRLTLRFGILL